MAPTRESHGTDRWRHDQAASPQFLTRAPFWLRIEALVPRRLRPRQLNNSEREELPGQGYPLRLEPLAQSRGTFYSRPTRKGSVRSPVDASNDSTDTSVPASVSLPPRGRTSQVRRASGTSRRRQGGSDPKSNGDSGPFPAHRTPVPRLFRSPPRIDSYRFAWQHAYN